MSQYTLASDQARRVQPWSWHGAMLGEPLGTALWVHGHRSYNDHTSYLKAPCTDILKRADAIMDYDLRHCKPGGPMDFSVCPIVRGLYHQDPTHSET